MFYEGKKVLVTGGTGMVGTYIVQELLKCGAKVRVPIHNRPLNIEGNIETIHADLTREEDCLAVTEGIDHVFHAAGIVVSAALANSPMTAMKGNLIMTMEMLHAAWQQNVNRFLLFSSSTAYPPADYPIKEEELWGGPTYPGYFGYGWMRRYMERLGEFVASKSSMKIALVRPGAIYGQWDNFNPVTGHVIPALIRRASNRESPYVVWGSGEEVRDFLHASDLAHGCLLMVEKYAECDPINIGSGRATTIKNVVRLILKASGYENARVEFDTSKPTTIPVRMLDTSKAKRILGFKPEISLEKGLTDTVKWYRGAK